MNTPLQVDPARAHHRFLQVLTGISVTAQLNGEEGLHDVAVLTKASFYQWIAAREGRAEDLLGILVGHGRTLLCIVCNEPVVSTTNGWRCKHGHLENFDG